MRKPVFRGLQLGENQTSLLGQIQKSRNFGFEHSDLSFVYRFMIILSRQ